MPQGTRSTRARGRVAGGRRTQGDAPEALEPRRGRHGAPRMTKRSRPVTGERTLDHVLVLGCTRAAWSYHVACVMLPQGCGARGGWIFQDVQIADRRGPVTPGEACERP